MGGAHEVNNPLAAIMNNVALVGHDLRARDDDDFDVQSERLDSIEGRIDKIRAIVNRLAEIAGEGGYDTRGYLPGTRMADLRGSSPAAGGPRTQGCLVTTAASGRAATRILEQRRFDFVGFRDDGTHFRFHPGSGGETWPIEGIFAVVGHRGQ